MSSINQSSYEVFEHQKTDLILHLLAGDLDGKSVMVFARTRDAVHTLATALSQAGIAVDSLHGKKQQGLRELALVSFKEGKTRVLVATDAIARDLDLSGIATMLNFDFPELVSDYQSRLEVMSEGGAGLLTFICQHNTNALAKLEASLGSELPLAESDGFEHDSHEPRTGSSRNKTPKKGPRSKPLQHKKSKWRPKKYGRN